MRHSEILPAANTFSANPHFSFFPLFYRPADFSAGHSYWGIKSAASRFVGKRRFLAYKAIFDGVCVLIVVGAALREAGEDLYAFAVGQAGGHFGEAG